MSLELFKKRVQIVNGSEENNMVKQKLDSFLGVLKHSYNSERFEKDGASNSVLVNNNRQTMEEDDKIISAPFDCGYKVGDVLFWPRTNTRWLLTTQRLTEKAYFIGEAKRAVYSINLRKEDGTIITFWAALKGPSEEKTGEVKANKVVVDTPNNSMTLWFGAHDGATEIKRYSKIMVAGKVWRVESVNNSTTSGLVEMHLVEDYTDKLKDNFEEQIARDTIPEVIPVAAHVITGMDIVDPLVGLTQVYTIDITGGTWEFEGPGLIVESSNQSATIQFTGAIGTATLRYVAQDAAVFNKIIKVTSIFG